MDLNVDRPVHGLDLQCVDSNPNVYMDSHTAHLPSFGPQNKAVFLNEGDSVTVSDGDRDIRATLPEQCHPTPMEIQVAMAEVATIISACFRSATPSAVMEAINTLVWALETANGHQAPELIVGAVESSMGIEVKIKPSEGLLFCLRLLI